MLNSALLCAVCCEGFYNGILVGRDCFEEKNITESVVVFNSVQYCKNMKADCFIC